MTRERRPKAAPRNIAVGCDDSPKRSRYVVTYEGAGDPYRRALHRPVAQIVVPSPADAGALVETLLCQGAVRLRVHREEVAA